MKRRRLIYGTNALVSLVSTVGIIILVNYISSWTNIRYDVTGGKRHTLTESTVDVLGGLDDDVEVIGFFKDTGKDRQDFKDLADEYSRNSDRLEFRFINPDKEPGIAKKYQVKEYATVILNSDGRSVRLSLADPITGGLLDNSEEEMTNGLLRLSRNIDRVLYFLVGHGERNMNDDIDPDGLGLFREALEDEGYRAEELLLLRDDGALAKDSILVFASPVKPYSLKEINFIREFLKQDGRALFMIEPQSGDDLTSVLRAYGINLGQDVLIDPSSKLEGGGDISPIVTKYGVHDVTEGFKYATIFPYSRSITLNEQDGLDAAILAYTGEYSWAEKDLDMINQGAAQKDESDPAGPIGVAVAGETAS